MIVSKEKLYIVWKNMRGRCRNINHPNYKTYGAIGIDMPDTWYNDYQIFKAWAILSGYKAGLTIDRINNMIGYSKENCRWATRSTQARNTRQIWAHNTSGYRGVQKSNAGWKAVIRVNTVPVYLGYFTDKLKAAKAYDKYVLDNKTGHTVNNVL